ncbi:MAG: hypothetical protein ACAI35_14570 [Candidatus Methylacidiphilales bacterium]
MESNSLALTHLIMKVVETLPDKLDLLPPPAKMMEDGIPLSESTYIEIQTYVKELNAFLKAAHAKNNPTAGPSISVVPRKPRALDGF